MKKKILCNISVFLLLFCILFIKSEDLKASDIYSIILGETLPIKSDYGMEFVNLKGINSKIKLKIEITNVSIYNDDGDVVDDTIIVSFDDDYDDKEWYVRTGETLTFIEYVDEETDFIEFDSDNFDDFSLDLRITKVSDAKLTISCHKPITMKDTGEKLVYPKVYYGDEEITEFADLKVKASKKNLVDIDSADSDFICLNGIYKSGKCKITVTAKYKGQTCSDSFILNIKSTLKKNLYVLGELYNYNTRSNIFTMSLRNRSKKQIIIYSKGAVALDHDYVSFDRNVKLTKNRKKIVIKPGKKKTINWKVLGNTTWYNVKDFEIHFKCKYKGKISWLSVQEEYVFVWKKGDWYKMS